MICDHDSTFAETAKAICREEIAEASTKHTGCNRMCSREVPGLVSLPLTGTGIVLQIWRQPGKPLGRLVRALEAVLSRVSSQDAATFGGYWANISGGVGPVVRIGTDWPGLLPLRPDCALEMDQAMADYSVSKPVARDSLRNLHRLLAVLESSRPGLGIASQLDQLGKKLVLDLSSALVDRAPKQELESRIASWLVDVFVDAICPIVAADRMEATRRKLSPMSRQMLDDIFICHHETSAYIWEQETCIYANEYYNYVADLWSGRLSEEREPAEDEPMIIYGDDPDEPEDEPMVLNGRLVMDAVEEMAVLSKARQAASSRHNAEYSRGCGQGGSGARHPWEVPILP